MKKLLELSQVHRLSLFHVIFSLTKRHVTIILTLSNKSVHNIQQLDLKIVIFLLKSECKYVLL